MRVVCSRSSTTTSYRPGSASTWPSARLNPGAATLLGKAGFARIERTGGRLRVFDAEQRVAQIARTLIDGGLDLTELTPVHEDLESYFLRLTGDAAGVATGDAR